jgi:aryl-alcohol dehydrogenase-like predicted oxidoreductase
MLLKTLNKKNVSSLCLGTWALGGNSKNLKAYGNLKEKPENILKYSFKKKINFFDTANVYGNSEKLIGNVFNKKRNSIFIASKVGCISFNKKLDFSKISIEKQIKKILNNLQTDYIDLIQLYGPPKKISIIKNCLDLLSYLRKKKIIRYVGISLKSPSDYLYFRKFYKFDVIQFNFNILDHRVLEKKLWQSIKKDNVVVLPRTILNFGIFTEKFINSKLKFSKKDHRNKWNKRQVNRWVVYSKKIRLLLKKDIEDICYRFCKNFGFKNIIIGATEKKHVDQSLKSFGKSKLKNKELKVILKLYDKYCKSIIIKPDYRMKS